MPQFDYICKTREGIQKTGTIESDSSATAVSDLRRGGLFIVSVRPVKDQNSQPFSFSKYLPVFHRDKIFLYRQVAMMIRSGLTILQALEIMKAESQKDALRKVLTSLLDEINKGIPLSEAMNNYPKIFSTLAVQLIHSAELSGQMDIMLDQIANSMIYQKEVKAKILHALAYPVLTLFMLFGVGIFMLIAVIPKLAKMVQKNGKTVPWATQLMLDISDFFNAYGIILIIFAVAAIAAFIFTFMNPLGRRLIERVALLVPFIGKVFLFGSMAQFGRTGSLLITSGLSLLDTLKVVAGLIKVKVLSDVIRDGCTNILMGKTLRESIDSKLLPKTVLNVITVGEETGAMSTVLHELGSYYEEELRSTIDLMTAMIEPVMLIFVGVMVLLVYLSFYQAATGMM